MKFLLFVIYISFITSFQNSTEINLKNLKEKRKNQIEKFYHCLNNLGSESFKKLIKENKGLKFSNMLKEHRVSLTKTEKNAIKECRKQILLDSKLNNNEDDYINNKVNLKRNKIVTKNK